MKFRWSWIALASVFGLLAQTAYAETGNAARGKILAYTCHGCHGIESYKNAYPTFSVPKLGGQNVAYLMSALNGYASGDRSHGTMHAQAASLSVQDRADIAAFFAAQPVRSTEQARGTQPTASATCVSCHGADGVSISPDYPNLAGQYRDYLEHALRDYKIGKRKNPVMDGIIAAIKEEDIPSLAAYFAEQTPALCGTEQIREHGKCD